MNPKSIFSKYIIIFVFAIFGMTITHAKDIYATSVAYDDVNSAVEIAQPGDTVYLPAGTADWKLSSLVVQGGINLIGQGSGKTIIRRINSTRNFVVKFDCSNGLTNELYNIGFEGYYNKKDSSQAAAAKRPTIGAGVLFSNGCVDFIVFGCSFSYFPVAGIDVASSKKKQRGLIFNNRFVNNFYPEISNLGYGVVVGGDGVFPKDINGVRPAPELGTENSVFVEDNFFSGNRHHIASNNGSSYVFRYNVVIHNEFTKNYSMVDAHGKSSQPVGSLLYEVYNNDFSCTNEDIVARSAVGIRGGDGVVYNNTVDGSIVRTVELWAEGFDCNKTKYPGVNQIRYLYIWNNTSNDKKYAWANLKQGVIISHKHCVDFLKENRDYFMYKAPNYTPFTYPHPNRKKVSKILKKKKNRL